MAFSRLAVACVLLVASPHWGQGPGTVVAQRLFSRGPLIPLENGDQLGRSVSALGDIDGDGVCDLVVGAQGDDDGGLQGADSNVGAVWVLRLGPTGGLKAATKISATQGGFTAQLNDRDFFGKSVAGVGDLDGDGVVDLIVGARLDDTGGMNRGAVYVLFLAQDGSVRAHQKISSEEGGLVGSLLGNDEFGNGVTGLGDLDGDGVTDIAVGAIFDSETGLSKGAVWILFLNPTDPALPDFSVSPQRGHAPLTTTFTDTSSGDVRDWEWDFGDGYRSWVRDPQHTYRSPGRYSVTLTVTTPTASFSKTMSDHVSVLEPMAINIDQAKDPRADRIGSAGH